MACLKLHTEKEYRALRVVYKKGTALMLTQRGYTGHEHFFENKIIHMNGRIYDPNLQTFLSPDINIVDPTDSQHYNRYSYALNNPLKYIDPDGNHPLLVAIAWAVGISAVTYTAVSVYFDTFSFTGLMGAMIKSAATATLMQAGVGLLDKVLFPAAGTSNALSTVNEALSNGINSVLGDAGQKLAENIVGGTALAATSVISALTSVGDVSSGFVNNASNTSSANLFNASNTAANNPIIELQEVVIKKGPKTNWVDNFQTGMDIAGIADPTGIIDFTNGLGYALRGQWGNAGISFASVLPFGDILKTGRLGKAALKLGTKGSTKAYKHSFKYANRVRLRALQDPLSHNFPYSFDDVILSNNPIVKNNGYKIFQQIGTMNGKNGVFEIGLTKGGVIDHRFFRPLK